MGKIPGIVLENGLIPENISYKIVVFVKRGEIVMPSAMYADKSDFSRIKFLKQFAVLYGYEPVFSSM